MSTTPRPVGGRIVTPAFLALLALWALGTIAGLVRFTQGLGAATAMNDGYPWGIWIAFDVVTGTALACGGYAVALLVYVANRGRYHPLVRPALLTSALGYSVAAVAISFDVGRYWNLWKIPIFFWRWNLNSALLEVALCVMAYIVVVWIEVSPALLERWRDDAGAAPPLRRLAEAALPRLERALPFIIALGLLLPTMHQSTLGSVFLVPASKLHPLWHTPWLPLLFLLSCIAMGYAVMVAESTFSSVAFRRPLETRILGSLNRIMAGLVAGFLVLRLGDLAWRGRLGLVFAGGRFGAFFVVEVALFATAAALLTGRRARVNAGRQLEAAGLLLAAGILYRIDVYLVAFEPGTGWTYFPSVGEVLVTLGLIATEAMVYVFIVKKFPILSGVASAVPASGTPAASSR